MLANVANFKVEFGGGLNTLNGPLSIADNESPNMKNVHSNLAGTLQRRNGCTALSTAASGSNGNGLFDYWYDADTHYLIAYVSNYLYKMDVDSNAFDGTLDALTFETPMANSVMEFEQFNDAGNNYLIMATHNRDKLQKYDGTTVSDLSDDTDMPAPRYIKQWKGYLFCANVASYESRVYYNDVSGSIVDSSDWSSTDYEDINTNDGDYITGLAVLKGRLYTFKRKSIHRWTYFGGSPLFGIKEAVSGIGTISSKSIVNISHPKYGEVLVFLGSDARFYMFDGTQAYPISTKIDVDNEVSEFNMSKVNKIHMENKACSMDHKDKHWYMCWIPTGENNDWCVVWDYYLDSWWIFEGWAARCCGFGLSNGKNRPYFIANNGKVEELDNGYNDDGTAITATYTTKRFNYGNQTLLKSNRYVDIEMKSTSAYTVSLYHRADWDCSWGTAESLSTNGGGFILGVSLLGTGVLGGNEAITQTVDLPTISHTEQFKFYTSDSYAAWTVYNMNLVGSGPGYGKSGA